MKKRNGFTLTEVVLAVIIVGMVGIAVASLSVVVSRGSSATTSHILLRNNLSAALRQIREDVQGRVVLKDPPNYRTTTEVRVDCREEPPLKELLRLQSKTDGSYVLYFLKVGSRLVAPYFRGTTSSDDCVGDPDASACYCYNDNSLGGGQIVRWKITRRETNIPVNSYIPECDTRCDVAQWTCDEDFRNGDISRCFNRTESVLLENVKFIPRWNAVNYPVPLFRKTGGNTLQVNLIIEIPESTPTINEATEEVFFTL